MITRAILTIAMLLMHHNSDAVDVFITSHNGEKTELVQGHLLSWSLNGGIMELDYVTDEIFKSDME